VTEGFLKQVFKKILNIDLVTPLPRIKYKDARALYGSDKPDVRFDMKLHDLSTIFRHTECKMFAEPIAAGGSVRGIIAKGAADKLSRKEIDKLGEFVKTYRAKGLAYTRLTADAESSSFEKLLTAEEIAAVRAELGAEKGDVFFVVADAKNNVVMDSLGALRSHLAQKLELIKPGTFAPLWITEFPLFEYSEEENRYMAMHHPFTSPMLEDLEMMETNPGECRARAYDIVMNGYELGGGSIRINDPEIQQRMFAALGFSKESAQERFGFLIDAFKYGAPPHGGMAFGLDRVVMLLLGKDNIRDVIAFPKVQNASELMTGAPGIVEQQSLDDLSLALSVKE
ncbi:MAG: aspartate--tRNA ligase, partial [Angelakisella sp.]